MNTIKRLLHLQTGEAHTNEKGTKGLKKTVKKLENEYLNFNVQWPPRTF